MDAVTLILLVMGGVVLGSGAIMCLLYLSVRRFVNSFESRMAEPEPEPFPLDHVVSARYDDWGFPDDPEWVDGDEYLERNR